MSQDLYQLWSIVINSAVGLIILWYTWETRKMRKQMGDQLAFSRDQIALIQRELDLTSAPYVVATTSPQPGIQTPERGFACSVKNMTRNLAHHVRVVIAEPSAPGLYYSKEGLEVVTEQQFQVPVLGPHDRTRVLQWLKDQYGARDDLFRLLDESGDAFIAVFFCDLQNKVFMMKTRLMFRPQDGALYWDMSERFDEHGKLLSSSSTSYSQLS